MKPDQVREQDRKTNGICQLLGIKEQQIRLITLKQAYEAADKGIHIGGCWSAAIPMTTLFYGGFMDLDIQQPTRAGKDQFVLSKGHSTALMCSIYADMGYFSHKLLSNSRSVSSTVNGHPGPVLPGVHVATGPLGQGLSVAQGFAMVGKRAPYSDVYSLAGDGELQEGGCWEAIMYAGHCHQDNLCVLVDQNNGQVDDLKQLVVAADNLAERFRAFGWNSVQVDGRSIPQVYAALSQFKCGVRNGKPTAIICDTTKGYGGFTAAMNKHKVTVTEALFLQEKRQQEQLLESRKAQFMEFLACSDEQTKAFLQEEACRMGIVLEKGTLSFVDNRQPITQMAPPRCKALTYDAQALPVLDMQKQYQMDKIVEQVMRVFAEDPKVVSIDSDLAQMSGLFAGIAAVDQTRAQNVGIAEANMSCVAEAYGAMGFNVWNSTFCPFFNAGVLRRIGVSQQERMEAIENTSWLSQGHTLDITFLATAANLDTGPNGATHMGNDDLMWVDELAHYKIIDLSCPQQLISVMRWIAEGNKGLVYVRMMRPATRVVYGPDYTFSYGKGTFVSGSEADKIVLISSGRQVHECMDAAQLLKEAGVQVAVVDMPSYDEDLLRQLTETGHTLIFAEQNNGYLWKKYRLSCVEFDRHPQTRLYAVNTLKPDGSKQYIHSGGLKELVKKFDLDAQALKERLLNIANA